MVGYVWIGLAALYTGLVTAVIVESARVPRSIILFGQVVAEPGRAWTLGIVAALAASAALALALSIAHVRGRRLERRMAAELDARWEELTRKEVDLRARRDVLTDRVAELHRQMETLARERARIEDELVQERMRAGSIRAQVRRTASSLDDMVQILETEAAAEVAEGSTGERTRQVVEVPEASDVTEAPASRERSSRHDPPPGA
jgi:chromosome segregation ATPase